MTCAIGLLYFQAQPTTAGIDPVSANADQLIAEAAQLIQLVNDEGSAKPPAGDAESADKAGSSDPASDTPTLTGRDAILESERFLAESQTRLEKLPAYAATFVKQERIGDTLTELQVIQLRLSHQPMRVFMKWENSNDAGQRVVYAAGENNGDMLVRKQKGFESRLGVIALNPFGSLALKHARYPVTMVGLLELVKITRSHRQKDLKLESGVSAKWQERQSFDNRECPCLTVEYDTPKAAPDDKQEYRKSLVYFDSKTKMPVCVRCYGWPQHVRGANPDKLDQTTLLEFYAYKNLNFEAQVQAEDFTRAKLQ